VVEEHEATDTSCKTMDNWDGQTINGYPYIDAESDATVNCVVETHAGTDDDGNIVYENNCGWSGPVSALGTGRPKSGSKPVSLVCPECGKQLAAKKGTTGAGYWGDVLNG
jgi:predicted RNA-binding Zn-ribbon protein involved in translation (DUF1610 family)